MPLSLAPADALRGLVGLSPTVALEIPRHSRPEDGGTREATIRERVRYDRPRTLPITASALLTLPMVVTAFSPA